MKAKETEVGKRQENTKLSQRSTQQGWERRAAAGAGHVREGGPGGGGHGEARDQLLAPIQGHLPTAHIFLSGDSCMKRKLTLQPPTSHIMNMNGHPRACSLGLSVS